MSKSQLYLIDEWKDLGFWIRDEVEYAEDSMHFAILVRVLESMCDKQQVDWLLLR